MTEKTIAELGEPLYYIAENATEAGFPTPPNPLGQSIRTWVRTLSGMQKEALVVSAATGTAWRFVCDEGAHLGGLDQAPNPLTYLSAGMIASYMNEITALAEKRGITLNGLELLLEGDVIDAGALEDPGNVAGSRNRQRFGRGIAGNGRGRTQQRPNQVRGQEDSDNDEQDLNGFAPGHGRTLLEVWGR